MRDPDAHIGLVGFGERVCRSGELCVDEIVETLSAEVSELRDIYGRLRKHDRAAEILDFEEGDDLIERPLDKQLKLRMLIRCADCPQRSLPDMNGSSAVVF